MKTKPLWIALAVLVVLTPLGLLAAGVAWGEWGPEELLEHGLTSVPAGIERYSGIWSAPIPDYVVPGLEGNLLLESLGYVLSAVVGVALVVLASWGLGRFLAAKEQGHQG